MLYLKLMISVIGAGVIGLVLRLVIENFDEIILGKKFEFKILLLFSPTTWLIGFGVVIFCWAIFWAGTGRSSLFQTTNTELLGKSGDGFSVESPLENSRFLTDTERDKYFTPFMYSTAQQVKNDGIPVRAILDKKGRLHCNFLSGAHCPMALI